MATDHKYNGWTNYETWCVSLWIDNEEGSYRYWRSEAQDAYDNAQPTSYSSREESAVSDLAEMLKDNIEEANPLNDGGSMFSDLLNAALSEVNWHEIAEGMIAECDKEAEEEDSEEEGAESEATDE